MQLVRSVSLELRQLGLRSEVWVRSKKVLEMLSLLVLVCSESVSVKVVLVAMVVLVLVMPLMSSVSKVLA